MFHAARLASYAALVVLAVLVFVAARPALLADLGLDRAEWAECLLKFDGEVERGQSLDRLRDDTLAKIRAKQRIYLDLAAERLTLAEAAGRVVELADDPKLFRELLSRRFAGDIDEERLYRHVLASVCQAVEVQPVLSEVVRQRLEVEMNALLRKAQGGK
jgi:hypothetical protein